MLWLRCAVLIMLASCRGVAGRVQGNALVQPIGTQYLDSVQDTALTVGAGTAALIVHRPNALGVLKFNVAVGCTQLCVFIASNIIGATPSDTSTSVYVDGVFRQALAVTSNNGTQDFPILLDGLAHVVEIVVGYQQYDTGTVGAILGSFVYEVTFYGGPGTLVTEADEAPARRVVVLGDSIYNGAFAVPPSELGSVQLLRQTFAPRGRLSFQGWGGNSLWDNSGTGSGQYGFASPALFAARIQALFFSAPGAKVVIDGLGQNDYAPGFHHWNAAAFGAACTALYDAIHAASPTATIVAVSPIIMGGGGEAATNTFGELISLYRTAKQTAAAGRGYVTYVDGASLVSIGNISGDTIHPTPAGQAQLAANLAGYLP